MQSLSRKDEEFLQFFVLFLLVDILIFILLYRRSLSGVAFLFVHQITDIISTARMMTGRTKVI